MEEELEELEELEAEGAAMEELEVLVVVGGSSFVNVLLALLCLKGDGSQCEHALLHPACSFGISRGFGAIVHRPVHRGCVTCSWWGHGGRGDKPIRLCQSRPHAVHQLLWRGRLRLGKFQHVLHLPVHCLVGFEANGRGGEGWKIG